MKYRIDFDQHLIRVTEANAADSDSNKDQIGRDGRTTQAKPVRQRHQTKAARQGWARKQIECQLCCQPQTITNDKLD